MAEETAVATGELGTEAVDLLSELIAHDTVNPPGNEDRVQVPLAEHLRDAGFEVALLEAEPGRPNLVADLPGERDGETLCLLGHVDTVPADPGEWSFSPWSGEVVDGMVRGRGAQDMKGQVAAEAAAAISLARSGWRPAEGALKLVITADEEMGAALGAQWLCREHPDAVRSDLVVNEGGGAAFEVDGRRFYTLCVGEKGVNRFLLRARGVAGHGSVPALGDNALLKLAPALTRFASEPPLEPTEAGIAFLETVLGEDLAGAEGSVLEGAVERLRGLSPPLAAYIAEPMLRVTMVPTRAHASDKDNVIPSQAEVLVDCRVPPGGGADEARARAEQLLGPLADGLEIEFTEPVTGNSSPAESPLADAIAETLAEFDPDATLAPIVMPGFSDSHWFRKAFGSATVYGFCPQRALGVFEAAPLVHAPDERAAVSDVELAAGFYASLCRRVLG
ncbi:MAG TPA: M20/M25/M40 family metallo-hydrolase [Solirubrobacterales bacterium]|nr:M20/M25/M40 family metallo-hydrolase [Solirubrobacterales bacterium]